jgi:hypothetical protein
VQLNQELLVNRKNIREKIVMTSLININRMHFEQALTAQQLRVFAIIRIALIVGILFYYFAVILLYSMFVPNGFSKQDTSLMNVLSMAHAVITFIAAAVAFYLSNLQLRPERLAGRFDIQTPEQAAHYALGLYQTSSLLLMAPIEAASFFGGVICMIGVQNGTIEFYPMYWLNAGSAVLLILAGIMTFPTRERVLNTLETAFVQR